MPETESAISIPALVDTYGRMVSGLCRRMISDRESARDAAQEVWLAVIEGLPLFRGDAKISTWIFSIARHVATRRARVERLYSTKVMSGYFDEGQVGPPCSQEVERRSWIRERCDDCLTGILHCLSVESRMAYLLRDLAELPYSDIAGIMHRDERSLRQSVTRSRRKLGNFLSNRCVLYNPDGDCACRMKVAVRKEDLAAEYRRLRQDMARVNVFWESERVLSRINYWKEYLGLNVTTRS